MLLLRLLQDSDIIETETQNELSYFAAQHFSFAAKGKREDFRISNLEIYASSLDTKTINAL